MIHISIDQNRIVLIGKFNLLKYYQLPFHFGYQKSDDNYTKPYSKEALISIINYFHNEEIEISISSGVKKIYEDHLKLFSNFNSIFIAAKEYKDGKYDKDDYKDFTEFLNTNLKRKLRDHQKKAAYHLFLIQNGANFSVPGSGKTSVVIAAYKKFVYENLVDHLFIIGPASSARPWKDEYKETVGTDPIFIKLSGLNKTERKLRYYGRYTNESLFFATYNTAYNDKEDIKHLFESLDSRIMLVLDEAHYIKRLGGEWADAVLYLAQFANIKCILTGTPIPRDFSDVFNMFDFLWLERSPINTELKNRISISNKNTASEILNEKIGPLFYRVRKTDLNLLPAKFHPIVQVSQNKVEKKIYNLIYNNIKMLSKNDHKYETNINLLYRLWRARLIRLRQALSYPKLISSAIENYSEDLVRDDSIEDLIVNYDKFETPNKILQLIKLVKNINSKGQKILIWSNFIATIELILINIRSLGIKSEKIIGSVPSEKEGIDKNILTREKIISDFLRKDIEVLIANPAACAESISLHSTCYHAIYYDLSYNLAQYLQSLDRIHRVGGSEINVANYYFLQYANTMEYKIKQNLDIKKEKMYDIIDQDFSIYDLYMFDEDDIDEIQGLLA